MIKVVGDELVEPLAQVSVVRGGVSLTVILGVATLRAAAVRGSGAMVLVVGVAQGEFIVERVVNPEQKRSDIDFVIVVRSSSILVRREERVAVEGRNESSNHRRTLT